MKKRTRYIIGLAGIIGAVFGVMFSIPAYLEESYVIATGSSLLLIVGLVLLAIAFGD